MLENRLDQFKQNWPLITAIILLIVSGVAYLIFPYDNFATSYRPTQGELVDYWSLIQHSDITTIILFIPFVLIVLFSIVVIWHFRGRTCLVNLVSFGLLSVSLIFAVLIGIIIFLNIIFIDGTRVTHLGTTYFDGHNYHLAFGSTTEGGGDSFHSRFLVYECGPGNESCHLIRDHINRCSYTSDCRPEANLIVIDKTSLLEVEDERLILVKH